MRDSMLAMSGELDLQRPRGSEVAKAGYTRVRGGMVGDPRQMGREMFAAMRSEAGERGWSVWGRPRVPSAKNEPRKNGWERCVWCYGISWT